MISKTPNSIYLGWASSGADDYALYYWKTTAPSNVYTVTTASSPHNITGLESWTSYSMIVSARNVLRSTNSSTVKAQTASNGMSMYIHKLLDSHCTFTYVSLLTMYVRTTRTHDHKCDFTAILQFGGSQYVKSIKLQRREF